MSGGDVCGNTMTVLESSPSGMTCSDPDEYLPFIGVWGGESPITGLRKRLGGSVRGLERSIEVSDGNMDEEDRADVETPMSTTCGSAYGELSNNEL